MGIAGPPRPGERAPWSWYVLGPEVLQDDWLVEADGGSFAPENVPQDRADATQLYNQFAQDPMVDPMWVREQILEKTGFKDAKRHLVAPEPQIPLDALEQVKAQLAAELAAGGCRSAGAFAQHFDQLLLAARCRRSSRAAPGGHLSSSWPAGSALRRSGCCPGRGGILPAYGELSLRRAG
jgi:hypothetical protein